MNLKTAARRLGVHYQTAYRWVRGGELVAVKIGSGYEISEAALARFQARRAATERVPDLEPRMPLVDNNDDDLDAQTAALRTLDLVLDRITVDADPVYQRAARMVAEVVGDCSVVYRTNGSELRVVAYDHRDPIQAVLTGTMVHFARAHSETYADQVRVSGDAVLVPQVSQRSVRHSILPQFHQYLVESGFYSAVAVPIIVDGQVCGTLFAARDEPGRPFSVQDREFLGEIAARVAQASDQAARGAAAWELRERVVRDLQAALSHGSAPAPLSTTCKQAAAGIGDDMTELGLGVGFLDPDLRHLAATKPYVGLFGIDAATLEQRALRELLDDPDSAEEMLNRVLAGELDYCQLSARPAQTSDAAAAVMLHAGIVRERDATPRVLVVVVHAIPEIDPTLS